MRLHDLTTEGKRFIGKTWLIIGFILSIFGSYGLGFLSAIDTLKIPIYVEKSQENVYQKEKIEENQYILASKSGTKFYFIWCSGSNRIKEENRVFFQSIDEAIKKGYQPAKNCPGM